MLGLKGLLKVLKKLKADYVMDEADFVMYFILTLVLYYHDTAETGCLRRE